MCELKNINGLSSMKSFQPGVCRATLLSSRMTCRNILQIEMMVNTQRDSRARVRHMEACTGLPFDV